MSVPLVSGGLLLGAYVAVFAASALACFGVLPRIRQVDDDETRRGLSALLVTSGAWAASYVGFLAAPTAELKLLSYLVGLIVGLSTVGPWLYFCSAYTGRSLHLNTTYRRVLVGVFLVIVAVKVTNPLHHLYFTTEFVASPFPHLSVHNGLIHWLTMGLSYALAAVGYFMIFDLFRQVGKDTTGLTVLVGLTGMPVLLDVVGIVSPLVLEIPYEPVGVAAFAVGLTFVYLEDLQAIKVAGGRDDPVVVLDDEGDVYEYNRAALDIFPDLAGSLDDPIEEVLPELADRLDEDEPLLSIPGGEGTRYYLVTRNPLGGSPGVGGRVLVFTDVTEREQYRRELERQNERLEEFASMVSHDLRNPLTVAMGHIDMARERHADESLDTAEQALERMNDLIDDILSLAREGQPIDETQQVSLAAVAEDAWGMVDAAEADLVVASDRTLEADPDRLQQLFENLFRNAVEHGGDDVTLTVGTVDRGFYVEDDGPGIPADERETVFESGYTTARTGTGFGLAIVAEIVDAHGWDVELTESDEGGARFEVRGVDGGGPET